MNARGFHRVWIGMVCIAAYTLLAGAEEQKVLSLSAPQMEGGKPLMQAIKERQSTKEFRAEELSNETLSNLLWAAYGINRPESGKRTAPSAKNAQEVDVYVATKDGVFLYDAAGHQLKQILAEDLRKTTGGRAPAAMELVYVADFSKSAGTTDDKKLAYATIATGCIIQNIYLFCASENLATVTHVCADTATEAFKLKAEQHIIMAQTVGYPAQ